ncbi:MAG: hypothetical protein IJD64_06215 [Clostridia bacterium]|nr:hypothetical protein [Clostridia bacterium]
MKVAIIGSRNIVVKNFSPYLPKDCSEIVSGGAMGIDRCAAEYAKANGLILTEFLPQYQRYGRGAPIVRNKQIVEYADYVLAFWDGSSRGTKSVIDFCDRLGKPYRVILPSDFHSKND